MLKIYTAGNAVDAQLLCDQLVEQGIEAIVKGGYLSGAAGELPVDSLISVWIHDEKREADARAAVKAFESSLNIPAYPRTCGNCGEQSTSQFTHCWSCQKPLQ